MMKKKTKGLLAFLTLIILAFGLAACGESKEVDKKIKEKEQEITEGLNKEMTLDILQNEHVEDAYVQDAEGTAKAVITFKKGTTDEQQATIVEQYNKELLEKYPDSNVNVIATVEE